MGLASRDLLQKTTTFSFHGTSLNNFKPNHLANNIFELL